MKNYNNREVYVVKLLVDFENNKKVVEEDFDLIAEVIGKRNWIEFKEVEKWCNKKGIFVDYKVHCLFEDSGDFEYLNLDEELFKLITNVEVLETDLDYFL